MSKSKFQKSFTLVEVLVGTFLVLIVFLGIFGAYQLGLKVIGLSEGKITATAIASGQIEKIRNLPYQSAGTKDAELPFAQGILDSVTSTILNNIEYQIETKIKFIVDEADGTGEEDSCNWDYKRAEVNVSWPGRFSGKVKLVTDLSPKDKVEEVQTCEIQPGGILSVSVFDAQGIMVISPLIEVFDTANGDLVDSNTPSDGQYDFPLTPSTYKIVVSKSGYSTERTYGTQEVAIPEKPHPIVILGQIIPISFSIDRLSSMSVQARGTKGAGYPVIHNVTFKLRGEKLIGKDAQENPVYKYSQNQTTNGPGSINIPNLEWDSYYFSVLTAGLDLVDIEFPPGTSTLQPIGLPPNTSQEVRLILKAENSLLITVQNEETLEPIFSATATLSNSDLGYEKTQYTDEKGETYFIPLEEADYNLEIEAPGYSPISTTVFVSGDITKTITLEQVE